MNTLATKTDLSFQVEKEVIYNGLKIVEKATAQKGLQPVLANILFETVDNNMIRLSATDFDMSIITNIEAVVDVQGAITLPAKKLIDIISRLNDGVINFELSGTTMTITSSKSKFDIIGISANEFPKIETLSEEENNIEVDLKPFVLALKEAGFAATSYESNVNILSGVVCDFSKNVLEVASTDGNRLARARKIIDNKNDSTEKIIVSSKVIQDFIKISYYIDDENIKLYPVGKKIMFKSSNITMISGLLNGQYPQYNQLIPQSFPKEAKVNTSMLIAALERISPMIYEKNNIVKCDFSQNSLCLRGDTPEAGNSQEQFDIIYNYEDMTIAFNYRYLLEFLKNLEADNVIICMNSGLSATVLKPDNEEDYIYLVMPVQIR